MILLSLRDWLPGSGTESEFQKDKESKQATEEGCLDPSSFWPFVFFQIVLVTQNAQASLQTGHNPPPPPTHTHGAVPVDSLLCQPREYSLSRPLQGWVHCWEEEVKIGPPPQGHLLPSLFLFPTPYSISKSLAPSLTRTQQEATW